MSDVTWVENWLAEKGLMYRPCGLVSSAALKLCDIPCADGVVDGNHLRLTPSFLASAVPPHITVTQYGSVAFAMTPATLIEPVPPPDVLAGACPVVEPQAAARLVQKGLRQSQPPVAERAERGALAPGRSLSGERGKGAGEADQTEQRRGRRQ